MCERTVLQSDVQPLSNRERKEQRRKEKITERQKPTPAPLNNNSDANDNVMTNLSVLNL
jgi:hypothetical protein